jgi:hypothetical protein
MCPISASLGVSTILLYDRLVAIESRLPDAKDARLNHLISVELAISNYNQIESIWSSS